MSLFHNWSSVYDIFKNLPPAQAAEACGASSTSGASADAAERPAAAPLLERQASFHTVYWEGKVRTFGVLDST